ncbi:MCE family protein [Gordonia pseudamarae]|jgi:phospholipid/cholesterol/gamma-HCH transport system substrate-binding protein|uniref:MCE family protein n=1 Tax=Gordonia pseudamarae TaxID=2831662 RepID=A0ABX6IFT6_9ACTN|nr:MULTISPECIES: MlaD family protein [Gordonia]MBD0022351.1 MCE family protein [Gordonia sp. (in: high G+C Gram-positive bacteria)]QHN25052.1 MCE family protein [Gordonia pseudamarae]QHN33986.1 MCE family protein [Gordonia pseudamarae]
MRTPSTIRFTGRAGLRRAAAAMGMAAVVSLGATGCDFDASSLPAPGGGTGGDTYNVHIQFANVLNLPDGAQVVADGVPVGRLAGLTTSDKGFVVADVSIDSDVTLPTTTTAMLRQSAPLSDVHIALTTTGTGASSSGAALRGGSTIPLKQTSQAPQIEDTLSQLATATGNGTFTNLISTVRTVNKAFPDDVNRTAKVFDVVGKDLRDLADNQGSLDSLLNGLGDTTQAVIDQRDRLAPLLTRAGVDRTTSSMTSILNMVYILTDLGKVAPPGKWLAPAIGAADGAISAVVPVLFGARPLDTTAPHNMSRLIDLINKDLIPWSTTGAKVDVTKVGVNGQSLSGDAQAQQIVVLMRMIGLVR